MNCRQSHSILSSSHWLISLHPPCLSSAKDRSCSLIEKGSCFGRHQKSLPSASAAWNYEGWPHYCWLESATATHELDVFLHLRITETCVCPGACEIWRSRNLTKSSCPGWSGNCGRYSGSLSSLPVCPGHWSDFLDGGYVDSSSLG